MKADKVTVTIKMESLSIDTLPEMVGKVIDQINGEVESGNLQMSDGDFIEWETKRKAVEF